MAYSLGLDLLIIVHVVVALALGWLLGYERYFRGRAAGPLDTRIYRGSAWGVPLESVARTILVVGVAAHRSAA